jgi:hypothetical protein
MTEVDMKAMMHGTFRMINLVYYFKDYSEIYRYIRHKNNNQDSWAYTGTKSHFEIELLQGVFEIKKNICKTQK